MVHVLHNSEQMASCIAVLDTGTCVTADSSFDLLMQKMRHFYAVRKNLRVESRGQRYQLVDFIVKIGSVVLGQTTSFKGVLIEVTYYQPVDSLCRAFCSLCWVYVCVKGKGSPYSITERRVPELIPVLGSQPADDVSHKPGGWLPLLSARPAVTLATLKSAATNFTAWWTEARWVWTVCLWPLTLIFEMIVHLNSV